MHLLSIKKSTLSLKASFTRPANVFSSKQTKSRRKVTKQFDIVVIEYTSTLDNNNKKKPITLFNIIIENDDSHTSIVRYISDIQQLDELFKQHHGSSRIPLPTLKDASSSSSHPVAVRILNLRRFIFRLKPRRSNGQKVEDYLQQCYIHPIISKSSLLHEFLSPQRTEDIKISKITMNSMVEQHAIENNSNINNNNNNNNNTNVNALSIIGETHSVHNTINNHDNNHSSISLISSHHHQHHQHHQHLHHIIPTTTTTSSIHSTTSSLILSDQIDSILPNLSDIEINSNVNSRIDFNINQPNHHRHHSTMINEDSEFLDDDYLSKWTPLFPLPPSEPTTLVSKKDIVNAHLIPNVSSSKLAPALTSFPDFFDNIPYHRNDETKNYFSFPPPPPTQSSSSNNNNGFKYPNLFNKNKKDQSSQQPKQHTKMTLDALQFLKVLGRGCMGKVILVRHHQSSRLYALKAIGKEGILASKEIEHALMERSILSKVSQVEHPFLIKLHHAFQNANQLFLLMDYHVGSDLATQLYNHTKFSPQRTQFYMAEILLGIQELHRLGILYRDLKPENILLAADGHIVLTDFGFSKLFDQEEETKKDELINMVGNDVLDETLLQPYHTLTFCGTPEYIAPELLLQEGYTYAVDLWSLGVIFYEMLTGETPFYDENDDDLYEKILHDPLHVPDCIEKDAITKDLVLGLLEKEPEMRIGCSHFYYSEFDGVNEIRDHPYFANINWNDVYHKRLPAPFVPKIKSETDVSHFDPVFVNLSPRLSTGTYINDDLDDDLLDLNHNDGENPTYSKKNGEDDDDDDDDLLNENFDHAFKGYSFINENTCIDTDSLLDDSDDEEEKEKEKENNNGQVKKNLNNQPENILETNERPSNYYSTTNKDALSSLKQLQLQYTSNNHISLPTSTNTKSTIINATNTTTTNIIGTTCNNTINATDYDESDDAEDDLSPSQRLGFSRFQQRHHQNQSRLSSSFTLESLHNEDDIIWLH